MYNDIELKDYDKKYYQQNVSRKQKLRNVSFAAIGKKFDEFRAKRALKKLEKAEKQLVDTRLFQSEVKPKHGITTAERIINYRSEKVAKLESKINFLTTGEYPDKIAVKNRAIKLKEMMWKNFRLNSIGLYSIPAEVKNNILQENQKEQQENVVKEVKEDKKETPTTQIKEEVPLVTEEEINSIKEAVQRKLDETVKEEAQEVDVNKINENEMKSVVDDNFDKQKEEITTDSILNKIENDLHNISIEDGLIKEESPIKPIQQMKKISLPVIKPVTVKETAQKENVNDDIFSGDKAKKIEVKEEVVNQSKVEDRESPVVVEDRENAYEKVKEDENKLNDLYTKLGEVAINDTETAKEIRNEIEQVENDFLENEEKLTEKERKQLEEEHKEDNKVSENEEVKEEIKETENEKVEEIKKASEINLSNVTKAEIEKVVDKMDNSTNLEIKKARLNILKDAVLSTSKELEETNKELSKTESEIEAAKNKELELEKKLALKYDEKNDEYTRQANDNKEMIDNNISMINNNKSELEERNERIKRLQEMFDSFEKNENEKEVEHKKK